MSKISDLNNNTCISISARQASGHITKYADLGILKWERGSCLQRGRKTRLFLWLTFHFFWIIFVKNSGVPTP
jgi:hypothetical protein